jgi:hypothetical protein
MTATADEELDDEGDVVQKPFEDKDAFEDVENFSDFDSNKKSTTVTFCHASLGDFFRDWSEGKVAAGEDKLAVGVVYNDAKAHVLRTCLKVLTDTGFAQRAKEPYLMRAYAATSWVQYLYEVQLWEASSADKQEIASMLVKMFGQEEYMEEWVRRKSWVSSSRQPQSHLKLVG